MRFLWDQDVGTQDPTWRRRSGLAGLWQEPADFGYGRELSGDALARRLNRRRAVGKPVDDASMYASLMYPAKPEQGREARRDQPLGAWALPESTHGAQCLGMAASPRVGADAAAAADLVLVQLPGEMVEDTSGGGLAAYVLDALHYIVSRVDPQAPLVVNLSYGAAAGPHDGTTLLDQAIEQLVGSRPGMVVVVPAGNLNGQDGEAGGDETRLHACVELLPGAPPVNLRWQVPAASDGDHYLELWQRRESVKAESARNALSMRSVDVELAPPSGLPAAAIRGERDAVQAALSPERKFGLVWSDASPLATGEIAGGRSGREMVLAAVAGAAEPGLWELRLTNTGTDPVTLDAWIERADPSPRRASLQSHFARDEHRACRRSTLSSLANGLSVVVVGGLAGEGAAAPSSLMSSMGPARPPSGRMGPDLSAPCEGSTLTPWRTVPGFPAGSWVQGNGTSIAAPVAARWVLNLLAPAGSLGRKLRGRDLKNWVVAQVHQPAGAPGPDTRRGLTLP